MTHDSSHSVNGAALDAAFARREFYMVRHMQTQDNAAGRVSDTYTWPTSMGMEQAAGLRRVHDAHFGEKAADCHYVSSAAPRAIETCRIMTGDKNHVCVEALNERESGDYGGRMSEARFARVMKAYASYENSGDDENRQRYEERFKRKGLQTHKQHAVQAVAAVKKVLSDCPGDKIPVIVSHSGTMRHTASALGVAAKFANAGLYHFQPNERDATAWQVTQVVLLENGEAVEVPVAGVSENKIADRAMARQASAASVHR